MGPATTLHMLLGAVIGWGILSPVAKYRGWASGPVDDWESGSKGWIVWVSLAIMLADALVSLGWLVLRPLIASAPQWYDSTRLSLQDGGWRHALSPPNLSYKGYRALHATISPAPKSSNPLKPDPMYNVQSSSDPDAPPSQLISTRTVLILLPFTVALCAVAIHVSFPHLIPLGLNILSILFALLLSIMGVRALGETDLNPVSGISKLTQLIFALFTSRNNPNAVIINLVAGAVSESGALQAGDLLQDLKTGHLLGAAPKAQFWGQIIGSVVGAVVSAAVYKLYTSVYTVPDSLFQVPTAYVWIFTARLVTGKGLPPMAWQFALIFGVIFVFVTILRIYLRGNSWQPFIPGGIAVAVGMYNTPSFTLARTAGGLVAFWWTRWKMREETPVIVLASGLILGEGLMSIVNLGLASGGVPHL